ncbi:MAG: hypothetical protein LC804_13150 [Acidobacteria bacterium]|nr:hypothetical protein [Acidobacteriota bacterium]
MRPVELLALLQEFHADKLAVRQRHVAAARLVAHYDYNNTYQYIIAREDVQLGWLTAAIADLGSGAQEVAEPRLDATGKAAAALERILREDRDRAAAFVERWRPRVEEVSNARHKGMLRVILGETLEHKRFFEQALAGRDDLLGRRVDGGGTGGSVMATRWV